VLLLLTLVEDRVRRTSIHRVGLRAGKARLKPDFVPDNGGVGLWDGDRLWFRSSKMGVER